MGVTGFCSAGVSYPEIYGGDWPRLVLAVYKWHAGEAWLAPLKIQAKYKRKR